MALYKVRDQFWVHGVGPDPIGPGETIELDDDQALAHACQIEPVEDVKPAAKTKAAATDGAN